MGVALLAACSRKDEFYVESLKSMEPPGSPSRERGGGVAEDRIKELKEGIVRYRREVERTVQATGQIGIYYKMLALQYMQRDMYGEAYGSLQQAIQIHPENSILFYYAGVCAGRMSQAMVDDQSRTQWLARAEKLYRRALALDQNYVDAMYGLSVLLTFELERPEEAEGLLERVLDIEKNNLEAMFLLGNVYYRLGRLEEALETYRRAAAAARAPERREEALVNQRRIEAELYGAQ
jgi:tetratricopeptide (TPR) repeat protein